MSRYKDRRSSIRAVNEALKDLLPELEGLKESYQEFIQSEKERIQNQISNLKALLDAEFSDNLNEDSLAVEILKAVYTRDQDIIEEQLDDN